MPWGVAVPGDPEQVMYVWFDALVNYISAIGWPADADKFNSWWPVVQFAGKDNLRQQSAMWQAMLMSVGLPPSKQIVIHGFITSSGQKMSKSLGNVINPFEVVDKYGTDALRYFLTREITPFEDGDFTEERFIEAYNAGLANGLGNLVSRVLKMAELYGVRFFPASISYSADFVSFVDNYQFSKATDLIWGLVSRADKYIQETMPFKLFKTNPEKAAEIVEGLLAELRNIAYHLAPFMPETSAKILEAVKNNKISAPLFRRIES